MVLWLASYPRSGNTFFRILLHALYGLPTYTGFLSGDDLEWVGRSELTGHDAIPQELALALARGDHEAVLPFHESQQVYAIKTHMMAREMAMSELPTILMVRDVRDVLVSFAWYMINVQTLHASAEPLGALLRRPQENLGLLRARLTAWLRNLGLEQPLFRTYLGMLVRHHRWSHLNEDWLDRQQGGAPYLVRFEDLVARPRETMREALSAVGVAAPEGDGHIPDFAELKCVFPAFFREGKIGAGRQSYPDRLYERLTEVHGPTMRRLGYLV